MKISPVLVGGSLVLNAALVAVIVLGARGDSADTSAGATAAGTTHTRAVAASGSASPGLDTWNQLQSDDLAVQRNRLRDEGFPASLVRTILVAQVRESFAARRKAIESAPAEQPYWRVARPDPKVQAELRAVVKEQERALRELLGPDPENGAAASLRRQFPALAPEKAGQLAAIRERYDEQRQDIFANVRSSLTPEENAKVRALEKAMHDEFAAVLTPAELEDYDLRTSSVANNLRYTLSAFDANEAEFRALYRIQAAYDDPLQSTGSSSQDEMRARMELTKQRDAEIAAALGPERYAEYQRATDYNYRQATLLAARLGLPAETPANLYALRKDYEQRRSDLVRSVTDAASRAQMPAQLATLQQEATDRVSALLGGNPSYVEAYKQYGGSWLVNFAPRPAVPPSPRN